MTPTATVCFMSRTANLPRGGYSEKTSQDMGLVGLRVIMAASPVFTNLGASSRTLPVRLSILDWISWNLQAMWAVWQSSTGVQPFSICPGWLRMMTWARKVSTSLGGSFLESPATFPLLISLTDRDLTLNPTLSPGMASCRASWCISTDLTSEETPEGAKVTFMPGLRIPVSTLPTGTVPIPPILQTSWRGSLRGFSVGLLGGTMESRASMRVGPLYQGMLGDFSNMLSPHQPEMGTNRMFSGLQPTFLRKSLTSLLISLYLSSEQLTVFSSTLLMQTIICFTPRVKASRACSRVWPSLEIPASNSPWGEAIISRAQSACEVPVIMFLMKSLWPGASMMVKWYLAVSNFHSEISMVIPLSLSLFSLSMIQAYLNEALPISAASFSNFSMVLLSIPPHLQIKWPVEVDFPEST